MAAFTRRQYAGSAVATTLTAGINTTDTSCTIAATTGWPSSAGVPFYVVIDPGTSSEEKCLATRSGSILTITRAQDDTTASSHSSGATIYPVFAANDADEANEIASKMTTKGDLMVTSGSAINRLPVGTNDYVLSADSSATNGVRWSQVASAGIENDAVTTAKILDGNVTEAKIASNAVTVSKIANGAVTAAKLDAAAAIQPSIADAKGDIIAATAADTVARVAVGTNGQVLTADSTEAAGVKWASPAPSAISAVASASVLTAENTSSTTYANLATAGPSVTLNTGTEVLITISSILGQGADAGQTIHAGVEVSGASTVSASNNYSLFLNGDDFVSSSGNVSLSTTFKLSGLTAGSNTFTMKYRCSSSSARFENRHITVFAI